MGAGDFPAGEGPAGHDPPALTPPDRTRRLTAEFEIFDRVFPLRSDGSGEFKSVHPVDQAVAIAVGIRKGSIPAAKTTGLDVDRLRRASKASMQQTVNDVVYLALKDLIDAGDIELIGSPLMEDAKGRPFFYVDYVNLRLPARPRRQLPVQR